MLHNADTLAKQTSLEWIEQSSLTLLKQVLVDGIAGKTALVSSFGAESAVLLHLASRVDRNVPVLFVDTRMMFQETLDYQQKLATYLRLTDVRTISASSEEIRREDVFGRLHLKDPDACCDLRKTQPLEEALKGFDSWINGRKRHQNADRADIRPMEADANNRLKINPLLHWDREDIDAYFEAHALPRHPLVKDGFTSISCAPCTARVKAGDDERSGRWAGSEKTECGIHLVNNKIVRQVA